MIELKTRPTDRLVELGGGDNPRLRPNVDCRPGPNVDLIADFNKPLPLPDGDFDGVFSQYALEHVSWRNVRGFLKEVCRILRPGGKAAFVVPNTEEQMRWVLSKGWEHRPPREGMGAFEESSCVLFGDLDYPENSHKAYFSPDIAVGLFKSAGFGDVHVTPCGECGTDMVVEAIKPPAAVLPEIDAEEYARGVQKHVLSRERISRPGALDGEIPPTLKETNEMLSRPPSATAKKPTFLSIPEEEVVKMEEYVRRLSARGVSPGSATYESLVRGLRMYLYSPWRYPCWTCKDLELGIYDSYETEVVVKYLKPGATVLDVGAHIGYYTLLYAESVGPEGRVVAVEPDAHNFTVLAHNVNINKFAGRVVLLHAALSDRDGHVDVYHHPMNTGDCRPWVPDPGPDPLWLKATSACKRLDGLLSPDSRFDVIKIDVQGGEIKVLRGMRELLAAQDRTVVFIEYWPYGIRGAGDDPAEFWEFFRGFDAYEVRSDRKCIVPATDRDSLVKPGTDHFANLVFFRGVTP